MWLQRIDTKIAALQEWDTEQEQGRKRQPHEPDWILELGIGNGRPPIEVHVSGCYPAGKRRRPVPCDEARQLLTSGVRARTHCKPGAQLRILDCPATDGAAPLLPHSARDFGLDTPLPPGRLLRRRGLLRGLLGRRLPGRVPGHLLLSRLLLGRRHLVDVGIAATLATCGLGLADALLQGGNQVDRFLGLGARLGPPSAPRPSPRSPLPTPRGTPCHAGFATAPALLRASARPIYRHGAVPPRGYFMGSQRRRPTLPTDWP